MLKRAFQAWRAARYGSVAKQQKMRRVAARIMRGALSRAFFAWKEELHLVDRNLAMKRKVGNGNMLPAYACAGFAGLAHTV